MKSIRGRIQSAIILTVVVSLVVVGGVSIYLNYTSTVGTLEQTMQESAEIAAQRVSHEIKEYMNIAYESGSIARLSDPSTSLEEKKAIIDQRAATYGFQRGNLLSLDGKSYFDGNDYSDRVYFQQAVQGKAYISEPLVSKVTGQLSLMVAAPVWMNGIPDTTVVGVVYYVPTETFLNDIAASIKISPSGSAQILNKSGTIIAHPDLERVKEGGNTIELAKTDPKYRAVAALESKMIQGEVGFGMYSLDGVQKFMAYAPIPNTDGWSICVNSPTSEFMGSTLWGIVITGALLLAASAIAAVIALRLSTRIAKPVKDCAQRLALLAQGDLSSPVPVSDARDETGLLLRDLRQTVEGLRDIVGDVSGHMGEMARGNLDVRLTRRYPGDFVSLETSIQQITAGLNDALGQINRSADQVASGSDQVSSGAQALSSGATEQASSVQELAATISEISAHIRANVTYAAEASEMVGHAGREIGNSNRQMQDMLAAMAEISGTSGEIGKIIKTIEDIAFQTNILALNAAVEAARAGEAGKGFAVVADEVRNLASKSAQAAQNTTALIESAIRAVENGTRIADETARSLAQVVEDAQKASGTVDRISAASSEQADSVEQVTLGIDQISAVVQTNSATAEESAAASEQLASQAQMLKTLVGRFRLREQDAAAPGPAADADASPAAEWLEAGGKY